MLMFLISSFLPLPVFLVVGGGWRAGEKGEGEREGE